MSQRVLGLSCLLFLAISVWWSIRYLDVPDLKSLRDRHPFLRESVATHPCDDWTPEQPLEKDHPDCLIAKQYRQLLAFSQREDAVHRCVCLATNI
jgi:hypothetical protein